MTEIPADVMTAAREAVAAEYMDNGFPAGCGIVPRLIDGEEDRRDTVRCAASAIMAERERCAGWHDAKAKRYREGYEKANAEGLGFISRALEYAEWHELAAHALRNPSAFSAPKEPTP